MESEEEEGTTSGTTPEAEADQSPARPSPQQEQPQQQREEPAAVRVNFDESRQRRERQAGDRALVDQDIKSIEKESNRKLSEEERQVLLNMRLGPDNLPAIAKQTAALGNQYETKFNETDRMRKGKSFGKKAVSVILTVTGSMLGKALLKGVTLGSFGVQSTIQSLNVGSFGIGGTLTGLAIGGAVGAIKGYNAEKQKAYGADGIIAEYSRLKSNQSDPDRIDNAIIFLHRAIDSEGVFQGSRGDLLKLLVFYEGELKTHLRPGNEQQDITALNSESFALADQYREETKAACWSQAKKGALRGALWGAGIGFVSDAISWFTHELRFLHHKNDYIDRRGGFHGHDNKYEIEFNQQNTTPADIPVDNHFDAINDGTGLNLEATPYGNALSKAVQIGLDNGEIKPPENYILNLMAENPEFTREKAIETFVYNLNFAQPPEGTYQFFGQMIDFNKDGVEAFVNQISPQPIWDEATKSWVTAPVNYENFGSMLSQAGDWLETHYPTAYNVVNGTDNQIMRGAINYALEQAMPSTLESAAHGAAIGLGIHYQTGRDARGITEGGAKGSSQGNEPGTSEPVGAREPENPVAPARTTPETPRPTAEGNEENPETERRDEPENWENLLYYNRKTFEDRANRYMEMPTELGWDDMSDEQKTNFVSLFQFINEHNEKGLRLKLHFEKRGRIFKVTGLPTTDSPAITLQNDEEEIQVNFGQGETWPRIAFLERDPDNLRSPGVIDPISKDDAGRYKFGLISLEQREAKDQGEEVAFRIIRKSGERGRKIPLYEGDEVDKNGPEIIGFDREAKTLKVITSQGELKTLTEASFEKIAEIKVYKWEQGGTDETYERRR